MLHLFGLRNSLRPQHRYLFKFSLVEDDSSTSTVIFPDLVSFSEGSTACIDGLRLFCHVTSRRSIFFYWSELAWEARLCQIYPKFSGRTSWHLIIQELNSLGHPRVRKALRVNNQTRGIISGICFRCCFLQFLFILIGISGKGLWDVFESRTMQPWLQCIKCLRTRDLCPLLDYTDHRGIVKIVGIYWIHCRTVRKAETNKCNLDQGICSDSQDESDTSNYAPLDASYRPRSGLKAEKTVTRVKAGGRMKKLKRWWQKWQLERPSMTKIGKTI